MSSPPRLPRALLPLALVAGAGCTATPEPPLALPELDAAVAHWGGNPVRGALDAAQVDRLELDAAAAAPVSLRYWLLEELPEGSYEPLGQRVRLIVADRGVEPLAAYSRLAPDSHLVRGEAAAALAAELEQRADGASLDRGELEALALPGVTASLTLAHALPVELFATGPERREVSVELWRETADAEELSIALVLTDVHTVVAGLAGARPEVAHELRAETLILDFGLELGGTPVVLTAPARFDPDGRLTYVIVVETRAPATDEERLAAVTERVQALRPTLREFALRGDDLRGRLAGGEQARIRKLRALDALPHTEHRRAALLELAGGAPLAAELALAADEELIESICARLAEEEPLLRDLAAAPEALEWHLEREALAVLVRRAEEGLSPALNAVLLRHTGEAGRHPGSLEFALGAADSVPGFYTRVLEENRFALEDSSPAARVRAFDWLVRRGVDVPGYDPLGPRRERRAALRSWEAALQEAGTGGQGAGGR